MICLGLVGTGFDFAMHAPSATPDENVVASPNFVNSVRTLRPNHKPSGLHLNGIKH